MAATQCELIVWCCLLYDAVQKDEPPEITYCVVNQNGMLHLQSLAPTQPMPEPSELDAKFTELLVSSDTLLRLLVLRFPPPPPLPLQFCNIRGQRLAFQNSPTLKGLVYSSS